MRTPKDWGQPCPNPACVHYNRMQQGNVSAIATYLTRNYPGRLRAPMTSVFTACLGKG